MVNAGRNITSDILTIRRFCRFGSLYQFFILHFTFYSIIRPGYLRHTNQLLPLLPSGPDGVCNVSVAQGLVFFNIWRRERDLNPRNAFWHVHTISSRAPSASRTSLRRPSLYHTFSILLKDNKDLFNVQRSTFKVGYCRMVRPSALCLYPVLFIMVSLPLTIHGLRFMALLLPCSLPPFPFTIYGLRFTINYRL